MNRDRNLLFGILAVQLGKVTPSQLVEAASAWAADPSKDLPSRLVASGVLKDKDRVLLDSFVEEAVKAHDGDLAKTLNAFGGEKQVNATFHGSIVCTESGGVEAADGRFSDRYIASTSVPSVQESPDRYTHVSEYGRGGMGRVLLVHDAYLGRNVALKELLPGPGGSSEQSTPARHYMNILSRFLQEARITGQLEHPSIVPVYELGHRSDGTLYYTMKLVRGRTLRQAIAEADGLQGRLQLLPHFVDLCNAIAYAHSQGVIHRDIKPDNVMVGEFGETVVLDWGLAKAKDQADNHADEMAETLRMWEMAEQPTAAGLTAHGQIMGTPAYMAPEQARGQIDKLDARTDVYALGVVLYELLTGQTPFQGRSAKEILNQVISAKPRAITDLEIKAPPELAAIVLHAMDKNAGNRYQSAKDLADEVQRFQSGALVGAYNYSFGEHLRRFAGRHKAILATAGIALAVTMGLGLFSYLRIVQARNEAVASAIREGEARASAEQALDVSEQLAYDSAIQVSAKLVREGMVDLAYERLMSTDPVRRNLEWGILVQELDQDQSFLESPSPGYRGIAVGRSGSIVASTDGNNNPVFWDLGALTYRNTNTEVSLETISGIDGSDLAVGMDYDKTLVLLDMSTGKTKQKLALPYEIRSYAFSPDCTRVAVAPSDNLVQVWDMEQQSVLLTLDDPNHQVNAIAYSSDGQYIACGATVGTVLLRDAKTGRTTKILSGLTSSIERISFSSDSLFLAASTWDGIIGVWGVNDGRLRHQLRGHTRDILSLDFSNDNASLVSASRDNSVRLWNVDSGKETDRLYGLKSVQPELWAAFGSSQDRVLVAGSDGLVRVWKCKKLQATESEPPWGAPLASLLSRDGRKLIRGSSNPGSATSKSVWDLWTELTPIFRQVRG